MQFVILIRLLILLKVILIIGTGYGTAVVLITRGFDPLPIEGRGKTPSDFKRTRIGLQFAVFS